MQPSKITYGATINIGNYEGVRFDVSYDIDEFKTPESTREKAFDYFKEEAIRCGAVNDSHFLK